MKVCASHKKNMFLTQCANHIHPLCPECSSEVVSLGLLSWILQPRLILSFWVVGTHLETFPVANSNCLYEQLIPATLPHLPIAMLWTEHSRVAYWKAFFNISTWPGISSSASPNTLVMERKEHHNDKTLPPWQWLGCMLCESCTAPQRLLQVP